MAANFNQTNKNQSRYFFATVEEGEQDLFVNTVSAAPFTDFYVGISGSGGNQVQINQMPDVIGTSTAGGEEMVYAGTASTYKTLSTLSATATGLSLSSDRVPGTGIATIESYRSNGSTGGFEFLSRGVNSQLLSTPMDSYLSSIGRPGATAVLGASGQFVTGQSVVGISEIALSAQDTGGGVGCFNVTDLSGGQARTRWSWFKTGIETGGNTGTNLNLGAYNDAGAFLGNAMQITRATAQVSTINQYAYPQVLITVPSVAGGPGAVSVPNATPTVVNTLTGITSLVAGQLYLTDVNIQLTTVTNPAAGPVYLDLGVRLGGNGSFSYGNPIYVPPGGIGFPIQVSLNQISDMGSSAPGVVDIVAYQQNATATTISITAQTTTGGASHQFKNIT